MQTRAAQPSASSPPTPAQSAPPAQSLVAATGEVFYRTKAAAVWWMLRGIVGDDALKQALQAYRRGPQARPRPRGLRTHPREVSPQGPALVLQRLGLPRPRPARPHHRQRHPSQLEARNGLPAGWLVAVDVRNDGYAEAEVPVTVRSRRNATETQRLRIPGRSSASTRIVFAGTPEQVQVNDGSVPETHTSIHTRDLVLPEH